MNKWLPLPGFGVKLRDIGARESPFVYQHTIEIMRWFSRASMNGVPLKSENQPIRWAVVYLDMRTRQAGVGVCTWVRVGNSHHYAIG